VLRKKFQIRMACKVQAVGRMWLATRVVAKKLLQRRRWMKVLYSYCCTHTAVLMYYG
jgi:hypothetical protein